MKLEMNKMLKFDYKIIRNEGDTEVTYTPGIIPTTLPNLVYIEGPNSSGKSTLLNIIASGLYGLKKDNIAPELKQKLKSLFDESYQKLTFKFEIINRNGSLKLESIKDDPNKKSFVVKEYKDKNKPVPLPYDRFDREYTLIYDIPENPTERLTQLTYSIKELQIDMTRKISYLRRFSHEVIDNVKNARNPKRIEKLKREIRTLKKQKEVIEKKIETDSKLLDSLEKFTYCKYYLEYLNEFNNIENEIERLKKEKSLLKRKISRINKEQEKTIKEVQETKFTLKELHQKLVSKYSNLFPKDKNYIDLLKNINFERIFQNISFPEY